MNQYIFLRVLALCIMLASTETLHGIARTVFLNRLLGKARALKLSIITGSLLAFIVCYLLVPGIGLTTYAGHWILGLVLSLFMAAFDLVMGRLLLRRPWSKAFNDFNPATGNYLIYGLALLVVYPTLVGLYRGTL